jgi:hypothetical protein
VHTKKRARLLHGRLNDLVFVKFNSRLLQKKNEKNRDPIEIRNIDVVDDPNNEWIKKSNQQLVVQVCILTIYFNLVNE